MFLLPTPQRAPMGTRERSAVSIWLQLALAVCLSLCATVALAQRSTPLQLLHPGAAAGDEFGSGAAISGDTMVVGAYEDDVGGNVDQGSVYVYRWTGAGWTLEATLKAADGGAGDYFGNSVVIEGDTIVVGAYGDDVGANSDQGSAYIFVRSGSAWLQQAKLVRPGGAAGDNAGNNVAISGDTVVVGVYGSDIGPNADQGSASVFVRSDSAWTHQAELVAADGAAGDYFGSSVGLSGDTMIVGAYRDDMDANSDQGSAFVFVRSGAAWTQQATLNAPDGAAYDWFGYGAAIDGDTAVIGAYQDDVAGPDQGSAHVFVRVGGAWVHQAMLTASDGAAGDYFGLFVAISCDTVVVGSMLDDDAAYDQGSAYAFARSGGAWTQQAKFVASDAGAVDRFGRVVAVSGDTAVIGAVTDDVGGNVDQGSAWVFSRVGSTWIGPDFKMTAADGAAGDRFGRSVAISGTTAVVGAPFDDIGGNIEQGSVYVFVRSGNSWIQQAQLIASDGAALDYFGTSVALWGDTALIGAYSDDAAYADQGSAYVFTREGTVWTQQAKLVASDGAAVDVFGYFVALSGDTALIGAYLDDVNYADQGSAYVFTRAGAVWTQQAKLVAPDSAASEGFGRSVALYGDTALIGAFRHDVSYSDQGSAYVFVRSGAAWTQQAKLLASDGAASDYFGYSVALFGDTALIGAYGDDVNYVDQGSAYVFVRSGTTWTQQSKLLAPDGAGSDGYGVSVALFSDTALIGAQADDVNYADQGSAYICMRLGTGWGHQAKLVAPDAATGDAFGYAVALDAETAVIGALNNDVGTNGDQGSAYAFDVASELFSRAHNDTTNIFYPTLAGAVLAAESGQQISATPAAYADISTIDTLGRSLGLNSSGPLRTPSTSTLVMSGASYLAAAEGEATEIYGQLRASGYIDLSGAAFLLGSRGIMTARTGSSLTINAPLAHLQGQTRLEQDASLTFGGTSESIGPVTAAGNAAVFAAGTVTNIDTWSMTAGQISAPLFYNRCLANFLGTSAIFGDFTNEAGGITTIRSGTLYVFGALTNNGTVVGSICSDCLSGPPGLDVGGSLVLGRSANLQMPFVGSVVRIGGDFDCAIDSNTRFDLSQATLQMEGTGAEQTLEVMSTDIGADPAGLDRSGAGHYPIGVLRIGPSPSAVRLVDNHDNDGDGQSDALYVTELVIEAGGTLDNTAAPVYYSGITNNGTVTAPENLLPFPPPCYADFNQDGGIDGADVEAFFTAWEAGEAISDVNQDGGVDGADVETFFLAWEAGGC